MKRQEALIYHVPGIVSSISIGYNPNASNIINVKKAFNRLTTNITFNEISDIPMNISENASMQDPHQKPVISSMPKRAPSNYENLIERLEKKYRDPPVNRQEKGNLNENFNEQSFDSANISESSSNKMNSQGLPSMVASRDAKKSKGGGNKYDTYDNDDDFIDDTECFEQVGAVLKSKKLKASGESVLYKARL